jgi:PBP1b-binding outer membrane lipoprotein LpoB
MIRSEELQYIKLALLVTLLFVFSGCSEGTDSKPKIDARQDNIWKQQKQPMEKAKQVESIMSDSANRSLDEADRQAK